jgi:hypothetical protein
MVVNHGEKCCANGCESCCAMLSQSLWFTMWTLCQWLWNTVCYAEPIVKHCEGYFFWLWIIVSYAEPVVGIHCVLCWTGCVGIMVCYAEPVIVNHCVLCWTGCVGIRVCYAEPVIGNHDVNAVSVGVNHSVFFCSSRCEPWRVMRRQLLWIRLCYSVAVGVNHGELC